MLKRALIALGLLYLVVAALLLLAHLALWLAGYLILGGVVLLLALIFERSGYRPKINRARGAWQTTGERFVDPATGHLTEVRFNPDTGERDYVDLGAPRS